MQTLSLAQLHNISGGATDLAVPPSISNSISATVSAVRDGLSPSELGIGMIGFGLGVGLNLVGVVFQKPGVALLLSYAAYSHFKPDFGNLLPSGVINLFSAGTNSTIPA